MKDFNYLYQAAFIMSVSFFTACQEGKNERDNIIAFEAAMETPVELKASDCFKTIRYVPLETTDSCLIGQAPYVQIIKDRILISTGQNQCLMFDKATGKFICQVGHVGNDPEGYAAVHCWGNEETGMIYFEGWNNDLVCFDSNGIFQEKIALPSRSKEYTFKLYTNQGKDGFISHRSMFGGGGSDLTFFKKNEEGTSFPTHEGQDKPIDPANIEYVSVMKPESAIAAFGPIAHKGVIEINFKEPETGYISITSNTRFWHQGQDLYFKENYNDTIYQVKDTTLLPYIVFDLGKYHWNYAERYMKNKDNAALITQILDGKEVMLVRYITGLFHQSTLYNAVLDKATGKVKTCLYADGITDDRNEFLPLQPMAVSSSGEYIGILPAENVAGWFEDNVEKQGLPETIKVLQNVGGEDNPVVVLME